MIGSAARALTTVAAGVPLLTAGYLAPLTLAAVVGRRAVPPDGPATRRFAILIPAQDEAALLGRLLDSLRRVDYPSDRVDVYVVADNCEDATAAVARSGGARVFERADTSARAKGFALRWLLERVRQQPCAYDAFVVLDADSVVAGNFLRSMDAHLEGGSQVVQAHYSVLNRDAAPIAALRYAALAALHYLRPLGKSALGLSCGLKGNGMCFSTAILERFGWRWCSLAEDVEFHLALVGDGVRVDFAPETSVLADMPVTFAQATGQNARWERGRLDLLRTRVPSLLVDGVRRRSLLRLDAAVEQLVPPLSVPFAVGGLCAVLGLVLRARAATALAAVGLLGQAAYLLAGLALVGAPPRAYLALSVAPPYIVWKVGLWLRALVGRTPPGWVRTSRAMPPAFSVR